MKIIKKILFYLVIIQLTVALYSENAESFEILNLWKYEEKAEVKSKKDTLVFMYTPDLTQEFFGYYIIVTSDQKQILIQDQEWFNFYKSFIYYFSYLKRSKDSKKDIVVGNISAFYDSKQINIVIKLVKRNFENNIYKDGMCIEIEGIGEYYITFTNVPGTIQIFDPRDIGNIDAKYRKK